MQAPSAVGFTAKQRLMMFWQHKRTLVVCVASVIVAIILIVVLFTVAEVKTFYAKFSGQTPQNNTQVTNVYTISSTIDGMVNFNKTANGTQAGVQANSTLTGNSTTNVTVSGNQTSANSSSVSTATQQNSTVVIDKISTNQTSNNMSTTRTQDSQSKTNSTIVKKHKHRQFLHKQTFQDIKKHFFSYRQYR